jgi:hypothetical protein
MDTGLQHTPCSEQLRHSVRHHFINTIFSNEKHVNSVIKVSYVNGPLLFKCAPLLRNIKVAVYIVAI